MNGSTCDQLAAELGRSIVAQAAPQELPLYRTISQAYLLSPNEIHSKPKSKDEMLGFGMAEAVTYLTPAILTILSTVIKFLVEEIKGSIHDQHLVGIVVKQLFKKTETVPKPTPPKASITRQQLAQVRKLAFDKARELKLEETEASLLADSIVGSLAVSAS